MEDKQTDSLSPRRMIRFGIFRDRAILREFADAYDLVVINGNMAAYSGSALAGLVGEHSYLNKPFIIDPQTYAFQFPFEKHLIKPDSDKTKEKRPNEKIPKRSVKALADKSGDLIKATFSQKECITPALLRQEGDLEKITSASLNFQSIVLLDDRGTEETGKYLDYAGIPRTKSPLFLIAPYFFVTGDEDVARSWLDINLKLGQIAKGIDKSVWVQLVIEESVLKRPTLMQRVVEGYSRLDPAGMLIWIDRLSEPDDDVTYFFTLVRNLRNAGIQRIANLYGGFFSVALTSGGNNALLCGVCNGLEYGQDRKVMPVGGGIPMAKFYIPKFHKRYDFEDFYFEILQSLNWSASAASYFANVCHCKECQSVISDNIANIRQFNETTQITFTRGRGEVTLNYPTEETKTRTLKHFMYTRKAEFVIARDNSPKQIAKMLGDTASACGKVATHIKHLNRWARHLNELGS